MNFDEFKGFKENLVGIEKEFNYEFAFGKELARVVDSCRVTLVRFLARR